MINPNRIFSLGHDMNTLIIEWIFYSTFFFMINKGAESLPNKDAQTYKQLAKYYDSKNYKKGLKNADKLLEIHPDHPQTNALKALFLQALGEEAKSVEVAKMSILKSKMKSMFCWHTCATIYKQKKDFNQASKCFQNALRLEPDNLQIMREAACLQVQVRDLTNHSNSRFNILKQKPNMIQNWVAFIIAHHLRGDFPALFKALVSLDNIVKTADLKPTEVAHYYTYRIVAFRDAADFEGMYNDLKKNKLQIKDQLIYHQLLHQACLELGKTAEAIDAVEFLLKKFPENLQYLKQYQNLQGLNKRQACKRARTEFKSKIALVHELACIEDSQEFRKEFACFAKPYFQKNLISLFAEIQILYESGKSTDIEAVLKQFEASLEKDVYPDGTEIVSPSEYLWSLYLLAQHYSQRYETLATAHEYICKAIKHTCTVPEFYMVKTDIEYKQHDNLQCLKTINEARKTDLADRYMNNICVKYLMRCEKPDIGENMLRTFMRDDASLYELQNHWYIIEAGKSFLRQRKFEPGLRHLDFISKQFLDFQANQLDFHTYCLRKWSLREYIELIEFNDNIYDDRKYAEAAGYAIKYLKEYVYSLEDEEIKAKEKVEEVKDEKEQKKKKKKKKQAVEQIIDENPIETFRKKIDYYGKEYSEKIKKSPMDEALNYAKCISSIKFTNRGNSQENKLFGRAFSEAIDVFIYFKKPLLVLRCLNKLKRTLWSPFNIHQATIKAVIYLQSQLADPKINDLSKEMIIEFLEVTLAGKSLGQYNDIETSKWKKEVKEQQAYLIDAKIHEASIIMKNGSPRNELIAFYQKQLTGLANGEKQPSAVQMQQIFYFTHGLQFYGQLNEDLKTALQKKTEKKTKYFSDWRNDLLKLPESTWSMWWLSDYDIEREEIEEKEEKQLIEGIKKEEAGLKTETQNNKVQAKVQ